MRVFFFEDGSRRRRRLRRWRRLRLLLLVSDRRLRSADARGEFARAESPAPTLIAAGLQIALTSCGEMSSERRWTPSAWTARATSVRELMRRAVRRFSPLFLADCAHGFLGQRFQFARGKIFFAELDVVDAGAGGFADFFQEAATARGFIAGECGAVGDVVEKAGRRH